MSLHRSTVRKRHPKLAGHRAPRATIAAAAQHLHVARRHHAPITPDARRRLSDLSNTELIDVLASELASRPDMQLVRNQVTALLAMAPTLTDRSQAAELGAYLVDDAIERAELEKAARRHILDHPMLTAAQVAAVLRRDPADRSVASRLRAAGKVVALPVGNSYRYPAFQFDDATASVRDVVAAVNARVDAAADPWGVASWWLSPSPRLPAGQTPADLAMDSDSKSHRKLERLVSAVLPD